MNQDDPPHNESGLSEYETLSDHHDATTNPASPEPTTVYCIQCGYNLTGAMIGSTCPECGRKIAPSFHGQTRPTSGHSIASLVLGICSIPSCVFYGVPAIICGILGIFFARKAKAQIRSGKAGGTSKGLATAGLICGIIGLCLGLIYLVIIVIFVTAMIANNP